MSGVLTALIEMHHLAIIVYGVAVHAILLGSVFSIYFTTNILSGLEPISSLDRHRRAPARRIVLFLADGLRADKCFGTKKQSGTSYRYAAPYLRQVAESLGVWGVSHTRVPTESRPGTVAIFAGLYEDVSAITRGWKENPVEFDSVLNESRHSFCWGSPDTLTLFSKTSLGNIYADSYDQKMVDFGAHDPSSLDTWVMDRFKRLLLVETKLNETMKGHLEEDGVVFFMHLLGMDILGHTKKPHSSEYASAISVVDSIVNETVALMANYFNGDNKTAFIFTADHGMTDWGSHGSSDAAETETPFLAWGAGIRLPSIDESVDDLSGIGDNSKDNYGLATIRHDVKQADLAPLMSILLGTPIPVNSVGILPDKVLECHDDNEDNDDVNDDNDWCTEALVENVRQLAAQFERHWELKATTSFFFRPFKRLNKAQLRAELKFLSSGVLLQRYSLRKTARRLMDILLIGIRYFETYDRFSLCLCVTSGFFGWMCFVILHLKRSKPTHLNSTIVANQLARTRKIKTISAAAIVFSFCVCLLSYVQSEPLSYYVYRLFPIVTWTLVFSETSRSTNQLFQRFPISMSGNSLYSMLLMGLALELLVLTFYQRQLLAIGLFLLGFYPILRNNFHPSKSHRNYNLRSTSHISIAWLITCTSMSLAYMFWTPIGTMPNHALVCMATLLFLVLICAILITFSTTVYDGNELVIYIQVALLCLTLLIRALIVFLEHYNSVAILITIRTASWTVLFTCNLVPLFSEANFSPTRLFLLAMSLANSYLLLSYSQESLLCLVLMVLLAFWWLLEKQWLRDSMDFAKMKRLPGPKMNENVETYEDGQMNWDNVRFAYFSLFFTMLAFFGLGNTSNVNTFSLDSVFHLVTVFSPFTMSALLLWKILCPFLAVACVVRAITDAGPSQRSARLMYVVLLLCDLMALQFFYMVRDEGSWLEIGTSLGHFVIAIMTTIGIAILHLVAKLMMTLTLRWPLLLQKVHLQ